MAAGSVKPMVLKPPRREVGARLARHPALLDHALRQAGAGDHDRLRPGRGLHLAHRAGHGHRHRVGAGLDLDLLTARPAAAPRSRRRRRSPPRPAPSAVEQVLQAGARVAEQRHRHRVVLADLARVDLELDQLRGRDGEGHAGPPRRGRPVDESAADAQDHVRVRRQRVADGRARVADRLPSQRHGSRRSRPCRSRSSPPARRAARPAPAAPPSPPRR